MHLKQFIGKANEYITIRWVEVPKKEITAKCPIIGNGTEAPEREGLPAFNPAGYRPIKQIFSQIPKIKME